MPASVVPKLVPKPAAYAELDDLPSLENSLRALAEGGFATCPTGLFVTLMQNAATAIEGLRGELMTERAKRNRLVMPVILIEFEVREYPSGAVAHRGAFHLADHAERRAFAIRAHEAQLDGFEIRTRRADI